MTAVKSTGRKPKNFFKEHAKRDNSPKWIDHETWTADAFQTKWHEAMEWYRLEKNCKDLKVKVIEWMEKNNFSKEEVTLLRKTYDWRCSITTGAIADCLLRGMPPVKEGFNNNQNSETWLRNQIFKIIEDGKSDISATTEISKTVDTATPTIQDRIKEQAMEMALDLDNIIDSWHENSDKFDPKSFKIINLFKAKSVKSVHARYIKNSHEFDYNELKTYLSGKGDDFLKESYSRYKTKNLKKLLDFYEVINTACDQIIAESKINRKPKAKKIKPAEEIVKKLKFKVSDNKLGIVSMPPANIIGSQMVVVYNTKTRKIGIYKSKSFNGLGVKGSSITEFLDNSTQKTIRKPEVQLTEFKEATSQRKAEAAFDKVKTTETKLNGRVNEDTIILKILK